MKRQRDARGARYWLPVFLLAAGVLVYGGFAGVVWWIDARAYEFGRRAMREFPGDEVDALAAFVQSENHTLAERNQAVHALGRLGDARAVSVLTRVYTGAECDHGRFLCQVELRKAIARSDGRDRIAWRLPFLPRAGAPTRPLGTRPVARQPQPVECRPAAPTDGAPWISNTRILNSFPPDTPKPRFIGAFGDRSLEYELHLWRDARSVFGQVLSPVFEADSPTSRLYDARFDARTGAISFSTRFPEKPWTFAGMLRSGTVTGTVIDAARRTPVVLRKLREADAHGAGAVRDAYTSRAQFECAMVLFRRY